MMQKMLRKPFIAALLFCMAAMNVVGMPVGDAPKHEMRGAWVATVYGIDWPGGTGAALVLFVRTKSTQKGAGGAPPDPPK